MALPFPGSLAGSEEALESNNLEGQEAGAKSVVERLLLLMIFDFCSDRLQCMTDFYSN